MSGIDSFLGRERFKIPGVQSIGIGGFSLFARVRETINLTADIPVQYVEDGSPMNDHFIRQPEKVKVEGIVGDIYRAPRTLTLRATPVSDTLGLLTSFLPRMTSFQNTIMAGILDNAKSAVSRLDNLLGSGIQGNSFLGNLDASNKSLGEQFMDAMENVYYGNQLISIDMPNRKYENMAITAIVVERDNTGNALSFTIEAQRFRIAQTTFAQIQKVARADKAPAASTGGQTKDMKDIGTQAGAARPQSFLSRYNPF